MRRSRFFSLPWGALGSAVIALLTGHWAAIGLAGEHLFVAWWPVLEHHQLLVSLLTLVTFLLTSVWLYTHRQSFTMARSLSRHLCTPHPVLILCVSPPNLLPTPQDALFPVQLTDQHGRQVTLEGASLQADINTLNDITWNWQQILRAVMPHAAQQTLKRLYLIGSQEPRGSFRHLGLCKKFLQHYLPEVEILQTEDAIDFEDFDALVHGMQQIIHQEKLQGRRETDMIIDVTGGFKTTSIAGASITFNSQVQFQYVQTSKEPQVYAYNIMYRPHVALEE